MRKSNKLTNDKVTQLNLLPDTTIQALDGESLDEMMSLAKKYGAAYFLTRRPYRAVEHVRSFNGLLRRHDLTSAFQSFRIGRRVIIVDKSAVKLPKPVRTKSGPAYPENGPPPHFRGQLAGHGDTHDLRTRPFPTIRMGDDIGDRDTASQILNLNRLRESLSEREPDSDADDFSAVISTLEETYEDES